MTRVTVQIPAPLRSYTGGAGRVEVAGATLGEVLGALEAVHQGLLARILGPDGEPRQFVNIFVRNRNMRQLNGLATPLSEGDVISIVPAVAGGASRAKDRRLEELRSLVGEITPREAAVLIAEGGALIDVREPDEMAQGSPRHAHRLGRSFLELRIEDAVAAFDRPIAVMCGSGSRSLFAAEDLLRLGYRRVYSVAGGFARWKSDGLPFEVPARIDAANRERFARHLTLPEVGESGQIRLMNSRVLLIGAGGLGSPAAYYLAAAGVGTLGIVDHDVVERSNLQRQIVHTDARVGMPKVSSARQALEALNPAVKVEGFATRLTSENVEEIFAGFEIVVDGSDNFPTRYLVNDACVKLGIANVHGSVYRFEGQASVFWPRYPRRHGPCYRCLYPEPPPAEMAPSCAEAGVLGVLPGVIGLIQAVETLKLLLGIGDPLIGRLLCYDALAARFSELDLEARADCRYCSDPTCFPGYTDYEQSCNRAVA